MKVTNTPHDCVAKPLAAVCCSEETAVSLILVYYLRAQRLEVSLGEGAKEIKDRLR